jgi:hypothetical protein
LRPNLTKWQAKYRRWYNCEMEKCKDNDCSPQEIQKRFPQYYELIEDLKFVNVKLIKYRKFMKDISIG